MNKELNEFINKYGENYPDKALEYIKANFNKKLTSNFRYDYLNQIYSELELLPKEKDIYLEFLKLIKEKYSLEKNIIEIGCGYFPTLAKKIDKEQINLKKGTITVYDPLLVTNKLGNIKLQKKEFNDNIVIDDSDLLIGVWPCKATEHIINSACKYDKDFSIVLCECMHEIPDNYKEMYYWKEYIYELAKSKMNNDRKIDIDYISGGYGGYENDSQIVISSIKKIKK